MHINCYAAGDIVSRKTTTDVGGLNGRSGGIAVDDNCYFNSEALQKQGDTVNAPAVAVGVNANDSALLKNVSGKTKAELGSDMFGPDGGAVYFRNYAWYDGKTYDTGSDASANPAVLAMRERVREQLDVSWDTFRCDYFAYLQKRSGETKTNWQAKKSPGCGCIRGIVLRF